MVSTGYRSCRTISGYSGIRVLTVANFPGGAPKGNQKESLVQLAWEGLAGVGQLPLVRRAQGCLRAASGGSPEG